jgi:inner membrane protein YidH
MEDHLVSDAVVSRPGDPPIADVFSWIRTDLSNLRTLMSWARTSVSLIGFGFTIFNFFSGFLQDSGEPRLRDFSRNLGIALVVTGTFAVLVGVYNYWLINQYLEASSVASTVHRSLKIRWIYAYVISGVLATIGVVTILFMFRVI